jgi:hypothetical protein
LWQHYQIVVPKSACIACPYHDDRHWLEPQQTSRDEIEQACRFDETIRLLPGMKGECFVHSSCVPLPQIDFNRSRRERRALDFGQQFVFDGGENVCSL